jgi:hypothetical protein
LKHKNKKIVVFRPLLTVAISRELEHFNPCNFDSIEIQNKGKGIPKSHGMDFRTHNIMTNKIISKLIYISLFKVQFIHLGDVWFTATNKSPHHSNTHHITVHCFFSRTCGGDFARHKLWRTTVWRGYRWPATKQAILSIFFAEAIFLFRF